MSLYREKMLSWSPPQSSWLQQPSSLKIVLCFCFFPVLCFTYIHSRWERGSPTSQDDDYNWLFVFYLFISNPIYREKIEIVYIFVFCYSITNLLLHNCLLLSLHNKLEAWNSTNVLCCRSLVMVWPGPLLWSHRAALRCWPTLIQIIGSIHFLVV